MVPTISGSVFSAFRHCREVNLSYNSVMWQHTKTKGFMWFGRTERAQSFWRMPPGFRKMKTIPKFRIIRFLRFVRRTPLFGAELLLEFISIIPLPEQFSLLPDTKNTLSEPSKWWRKRYGLLSHTATFIILKQKLKKLDAGKRKNRCYLFYPE